MVDGTEHVDNTIPSKLTSVPFVFLPTPTVNRSDAIVDTINTQLIVSQSNDGAVLLVSRIGGSIVTIRVSLVQYPQRTDQWKWYGPMGTWCPAKWVKGEWIDD